MLAIFRTEWFKLRKSNIIPFILVGPVIVLAIVYGVNLDEPELTGVKYYYATLMANMFYGILFLPLMIGILTTLICRFEHQAGGWKMLFASPASRTNIYISKFLVICSWTLIMQFAVIAAIYIGGLLKGYNEPFPYNTMLLVLLGGWVATFPLISFMLWLSTWLQSFAAPFAVNVIFTIPTLLVVNSEKLAPFYPWAQPFMMMAVSEEADGFVYTSVEKLAIVIVISFIVFFASGLIYINRKES